MGLFERDNCGNMLMVRKPVSGAPGHSPRGEVLVDALDRRVNKRGYLVDGAGNVVTRRGDHVLARGELDPMTEDIPPEIFRALFLPIGGNASRNLNSTKKRAATAKNRAVTTNL